MDENLMKWMMMMLIMRVVDHVAGEVFKYLIYDLDFLHV